MRKYFFAALILAFIGYAGYFFADAVTPYVGVAEARASQRNVQVKGLPDRHLRCTAYGERDICILHCG